MKKLIALLLIAVMLMCCGCGGGEPEVTPTPEVTATPTPTPSPTPAPVYTNPLNGEILDEPYSGRIIACSISNKKDAFPHAGINNADIFMEMYVNNNIVRGLALFTDISDAGVVGSIRSNRLMFNDIVTHYDAITLHSGGSNKVLNATRNEGIDNINVGLWDAMKNEASYRDTEHKRPYENTLFVNSDKLVSYAEAKKFRMTTDPDKDYYLTFVDDGTPDGEAAGKISIIFDFKGTKKETIMEYNAETGKYVYHQYKAKMTDLFTGEEEAFTNVIVMDTKITMNGIYQVADFVAGGTGYYANGGKLIPITWSCDGETEAFRFTTADGQPLEMGRGNTYIAIVPTGSPVSWE